LQRNFASKFASLLKKNKELYDKTLNLPSVTRKDKFNEIIKELKKPRILTKAQIDYLNSKLRIQDKWARLKTN